MCRRMTCEELCRKGRWLGKRALREEPGIDELLTARSLFRAYPHGIEALKGSIEIMGDEALEFVLRGTPNGFKGNREFRANPFPMICREAVIRGCDLEDVLTSSQGGPAIITFRDQLMHEAGAEAYRHAHVFFILTVFLVESSQATKLRLQEINRVDDTNNRLVENFKFQSGFHHFTVLYSIRSPHELDKEFSLSRC